MPTTLMAIPGYYTVTLDTGTGAYTVGSFVNNPWLVGDDETDISLLDGSTGDGRELPGEQLLNGPDVGGVLVETYTGWMINGGLITTDGSAFYLYAPSDTLAGTSGTATYGTFYYDGGPQNFSGDASGNNWTGSGWNDTAAGNDGNDTLNAGEGDDSVSGGNGADAINGGAGNDSLDGGAALGSNYVDNFFGPDIPASMTPDTLHGNDGNDTLIGADGYAGAYYGDAGNDYLDGGTGQVLNTGPGFFGDTWAYYADTLVGGTGDDTYVLDTVTYLSAVFPVDTYSTGYTAITENADEGNDTVIVDFNYTLALANIENITGRAGGGAVRSVVGDTGNNVVSALVSSGTATFSLSGGDGNDTIYGAAWGDTLNGGAGNDTLSGDAGDDSIYGGDGSSFDDLYGGEGNDTLVGGDDQDYLLGGGGNDTYILSSDIGTADSIFEGVGGGFDTIVINTSYTLATANVENLTIYGGEGMAYTGTGDSGSNVITGLPGDLSGGRFSLMGMDGNDTLVGSGNNDTLNGGSSTDTLIGGAGDDTYVLGNDISDTITEGAAAGTDTVLLSYTNYTLTAANVENLTLTGGEGGSYIVTGNAANNVISGIVVGTATFAFNGGDGHDTLNGAAFNDTLNGGLGRDVLTGGTGDDSLLGGGSNDIVTGGDGNDYLDGGNAGDKLYGNAGRDTLHGGAGDDTLAGAGGRDVFLFDANLATNGVDTITDFLVGTDLVYVAVGVSGLGYTGYLNAANFVSGAAATTADQRFVYDSGNLYYDADGNGAGAQVQFATFSNAALLTASDIVIV